MELWRLLNGEMKGTIYTTKSSLEERLNKNVVVGCAIKLKVNYGDTYDSYKANGLTLPASE